MLELSHLPTSVDITLFRYNHLDNQLWTLIRNELDWIHIEEDMMIVSASQIVRLIEHKYQQMLNKINATGAEFLHKDVNSIYFIYMMCGEMDRIKYIKFTLSKQKKFNRMMVLDDEKVLKFDFKVLTVTLRLREFYSKKETNILNRVLESHGILQTGTPFTQYKMDKLLNKIDDILLDVKDEDEGDLLTGLLDILDPKLERDNPLVLLVTDY